MDESRAIDVVRQLGLRSTAAATGLAIERSTYERLLREHGNSDGAQLHPTPCVCRITDVTVSSL
jgi:hypothetical protein